ADQFPPARIDAADAGVGVRGQGQDVRGVRARGARALPVLLVRRCDAAVAGEGGMTALDRHSRESFVDRHSRLRGNDGTGVDGMRVGGTTSCAPWPSKL